MCKWHQLRQAKHKLLRLLLQWETNRFDSGRSDVSSQSDESVVLHAGWVAEVLGLPPSLMLQACQGYYG